jgi:sec-independent protein translocase protein TatA
MGALAPWHWAVLIIVILLIFGGRLLPRLGKSLGQSITGVKKGIQEGTQEFKSAVSEDKAASTSVEPPKNDGTDQS